MVCTLCDSKTKITNSRYMRSKGYTWRRHTCPRCFAVFTTHEHVETVLHYRIKHADGSLEPLSRDGLFFMVHESLSHRKSHLDDATALTDTILAGVLSQKRLVIDYASFHELAGAVLRRFDRTAYIKYTSQL